MLTGLLKLSDYGIKESSGYFGRLEGVVFSELFGCEIPFMTVKGSEVVYARRCAEFIEKLSLDDEAVSSLFEAAADYLTDFFDEHSGEYDIDESNYEEITAESVVKLCTPGQLIFEQHDLLSEEECPVAFSMKLVLKELPDEFFEIAMRENMPVYVGEYRGVSPWNENILKKKWNYIS